MSNLSITTKIFQQLSDSSNSVLPIATKDTLSNCAITYIYDKKASKEDGKERAIEEFGTEVIWIGGIPLLKKLFDKTIYKLFKADPNFDVRNLKKNANGKLERLEFLAKNAKDAAQKETLENILKSKKMQNMYKGLFISKFITATAATLAALSGLIIYKQKTTQKELEQKFKQKALIENSARKSGQFDKFFEKKNDVSFGNALTTKMADFMFNPVKNMSILDAGITTTRLAQARKGERLEIGFKEGFQIAFIYLLAKPIQKGLEAISNGVFKKPIKVEYQLLSNENFSELMKAPDLKKSIKTLLSKKDNELLDYIFNNDNALTKMLKISGEIPTIKKSDGIIDSLAHIELDEVRKSTKNISQLLEATGTKVDKDQFLKQVKNFKAASVVLNILIGAGAIGVLQPMLNIVLRKKNNNGETINPAIKNMEQEMAQKFAFKG